MSHFSFYNLFTIHFTLQFQSSTLLQINCLFNLWCNRYIDISIKKPDVRHLSCNFISCGKSVFFLMCTSILNTWLPSSKSYEQVLSEKFVGLIQTLFCSSGKFYHFQQFTSKTRKFDNRLTINSLHISLG